MIVVADAGPLNYLVLIEAADVLKPLYSRVLVPQTVAEELQEHNAPPTVRAWIAQPPEWCEIRSDPPYDPALQLLDPGERAAIVLALSLHADRLLIDEWDGRAEAERRQLLVTGTLGVLAEAYQQHLLDFETALARLRQTNFYIIGGTRRGCSPAAAHRRGENVTVTRAPRRLAQHPLPIPRLGSIACSIAITPPIRFTRTHSAHVMLINQGSLSVGIPTCGRWIHRTLTWEHKGQAKVSLKTTA